MHCYNFASLSIVACFIICLTLTPLLSAQNPDPAKSTDLGQAIKNLPEKTLNVTLSLTQAIDSNMITIPSKLPYTTLYENLKNLPAQGFKDAKNAYLDNENIKLILMAAGGSIALHDKADEKIADNFEKHRTLPQDMDKLIDWAGCPGTHFAGTGLWYLLAAYDKNEMSKQRSWAMMRALGVTGATTLILKGIVGDHTPNGKAYAWPSGHTSSSFTVAAVLDEFYGPKVGIPAYLGAAFVGFRMMDSGDHWASDVLFGAVLGYIVGHHIAGEHKQLELGGFEITPLSSTNPDSTAIGLALTKKF